MELFFSYLTVKAMLSINGDTEYALIIGVR